MHYAFSPNLMHYFTLEDTSIRLVKVYSNVIRRHTLIITTKIDNLRMKNTLTSCHCQTFDILLTTIYENKNEVLNYCKH